MSGHRLGVELPQSAALAGTATLGSYRQWVRVFALASADFGAFLLANLLFRYGRDVPRVAFLQEVGNAPAVIDIFLILAVIFIAVRYVSGDYSRRWLFWDEAFATTIALLVLSTPCIAIHLYMPGVYSITASVLSWGSMFFLIPMFRHLMRRFLTRAGIWTVRTAIVANSSQIDKVYKALSDAQSLGFDICMLVTNGGANSKEDYGADLRDMTHLVMESPAQMASDLTSRNCSNVVIATDDVQSQHFVDTVQQLVESGISVFYAPTFRALPIAGVTTSYFFGGDMLLCQVQNRLRRLPRRLAKRLFDFAGAAVLIVLFAPLLAVISAMIYLEDRGPVFFRQPRIGRFGDYFKCMKFRTMCTDAEARLERWSQDEPELYAEFRKSFKIKNDPRITKIGRFLRATSLDELPQLFNVLFGSMSLVGPRPMLLAEPESYGRSFFLYTTVRPGITGVWQVLGRDEVSYEQRALYNDWYILNQSFWLDIVILARTASVVISRRGAS